MLVCFVDDTRSVGCSEVVDDYRLKREFGEEWFRPQGLIICPRFIVDQYNILLTIERDLQVQLKLKFFNNVKKILATDNLSDRLSGYLIIDSDLEELKPRCDMKTHAVLLSSHLFTIIELVDNDDQNCIEKAERKLERIARAVRKLVDDKICVKHVIIFPGKVRLPTSLLNPDNSILYEDELTKLLMDFLELSTESNNISVDRKTAFAQMLRLSFLTQSHPETEEDAICRAAERLFIQCPEQKITYLTQIDFNSIKLTDIQNKIQGDLLVGDTLVWGGYGIGKTIAIIAAITESIDQYKKSVKNSKGERKGFKILFLSAQGLLCDQNLRMSPFLLMTEKWITERCEELRYAKDFQVINYTHFLDRNIDFAIETKTESEEKVVFRSYLLKTTDLKIMMEKSWRFNSFNIVILEETHAVDSCVIKDFVAHIKMARKEKLNTNIENPKLWISSNSERLHSILPDFMISPRPHVKQENMRNVPAVRELARAIDNDIVPERYPSVAIPASPVTCRINVSYESERDDQARIKKIVKLALRWKKWLSKSSVLFIDCEKSSLLERLRAVKIPVKAYNDKYNIGEPLFLHHSDPVEAILAGSEWHVLIVHTKMNTLNSIGMIKLFNKRIISRATTKVFIFSDAGVRDDKEAGINEEDRESLNIDSFKRMDSEHSDEFYNYTSEDVDSYGGQKLSLVPRSRGEENESFDNLNNLLENMNVMHKILTSNKKLSHHKGFDFVQLRHIDSSFSDDSPDIYLVQRRGNAFIVQLNSDIKDEVLKSQARFENIWKVRLPAYCGPELVSNGDTGDFTCVSKLFHLLQPKLSSSVNDQTSSISFDAEEVDRFSRNCKYSFYRPISEVSRAGS